MSADTSRLASFTLSINCAKLESISLNILIKSQSLMLVYKWKSMHTANFTVKCHFVRHRATIFLGFKSVHL